MKTVKNPTAARLKKLAEKFAQAKVKLSEIGSLPLSERQVVIEQHARAERLLHSAIDHLFPPDEWEKGYCTLCGSWGSIPDDSGKYGSVIDCPVCKGKSKVEKP